MKKLAIAALLCLGLVFQVRASEVQTSIGVSAGPFMSRSYFLNQEVGNSSVLGNDLDFLRHRKSVAWGVGLRSRSMNTAIGKLTYTGGSFLLGYYSNRDKSRSIGWHIVGGLGAGSLSGVGKGYKRESTPTNVEIRLGLDKVIARGKDSDSGKKLSAVVLTLDLGYEGFAVRLKPVNAGKNVVLAACPGSGICPLASASAGTNAKDKMFRTAGIRPSLGVAYYFGK